jgi:Bacteriophage replication gene A protein (GPA)
VALLRHTSNRRDDNGRIEKGGKEDGARTGTGQPRSTETMRIADQIWTARFKRKIALTPKQSYIVDRAADDELQMWKDHEAWRAAQHLRPLAEKIAHNTQKLQHVNEIGLALLIADDDELLEEAKKWAAMASLNSDCHPRDKDPLSVRRRLRRMVDRATIHTAGILELIGGPLDQHRPAYVDNWTLRRFEQQQAANTAFLKKHVAINLDQRIPLSDIASSAAASRRAQWYAMILGMREIASRDGLTPVFVTVTLPGEWHLSPRSGEPGDARHSPTDAAKEIGKRWHNALSMFKGRKGQLFGIRVAEPHADGTPHLHCVLWVKSDQCDDLRDCLARHFPAGNQSEREYRDKGDFTKGPALVIKKWEERSKDDARGCADAASYALSYVLDVLEDDTGNADPIADAGNLQKSRTKSKEIKRVKAWARHARLRRLSLVGLNPGTIGRWATFYRALKGHGSEETLAHPQTKAILHAMKRAQWGSVLRLLGAFSSKNDQPIKPVREVRTNRWGDAVKTTIAFRDASPSGKVLAFVRTGVWQIVPAPPTKPPKDVSKPPKDIKFSFRESFPSDPPPASSRDGPTLVRSKTTQQTADNPDLSTHKISVATDSCVKPTTIINWRRTYGR